MLFRARILLVVVSSFFVIEHVRRLYLMEKLELNIPPFESRLRSSRVLLGIFSCDAQDQTLYRQVFRSLFALHPNVCSLGEYSKLTSDERQGCELVYTFVVGGGGDESPTEIVNNSTAILTSYKAHSRANTDMENDDMTFLNIRENMNEGKSQTWFYYASQRTHSLNIDYVGKTDVDALPKLDKYFHWAKQKLLPFPYNNHVIAASFTDKRFWPRNKWNRARETYFIDRYEAVHIYARGQMYIVSSDLAKGIAEIADSVNKDEYAASHEDHDVSAMAYMAVRNDTSLSIVQIGTSEMFWVHPLKIVRHENGTDNLAEWRQTWALECSRVAEIQGQV